MKRLIGICFLMLLMTPIIIAYETEIYVKTMPEHEVHLSILDSTTSTFNAFKVFKGDSDQYGDVSFNYVSNESVFDLRIIVKKGDARVLSEEFRKKYVAGEPISIEIVPEGFEVLRSPSEMSKINETATNETETNETFLDTNETEGIIPEENLEETKQNETKISAIAGSVISKVKDNKSTIIYVIVVIGSIVLFFMKHKSRSKEIKVTKLSDKIDRDSQRQAILDIEGKLKDVQDELDKIG